MRLAVEGSRLCWGRGLSALVLLFARVIQCEKLCGVLDQRSAIVDNKLYISSGNYTFDDNQGWHNSSDMYWLDLGASVDVSGPIDLSLLGQSKLPSAQLTGGEGPVMGGAGGTFFYDHTMLYAYGGIIGDSGGIQNDLWAFNTTNSTWGLVTVEGGQLSFGSDTEGVHASDPRSGLSFYTGGWTMSYNNTDNNTNHGMVKFDSSNPISPQWSFETAQTGIQGPDILKGSMVFVRRGRAGVLIAFGGYNTTHPGTEFGGGWAWDQRSFADIFVYDIFSNTWYLIEATGDLPPLRAEFCAGVSSAPDDSSFQITMYGGYDLFSHSVYDDVWVLTVPAFEWIQMQPTDDPDNGVGRNRHNCDTWKEGPIIVSGGGQSGPKCNTSHPPFKVLNTSTFAWETHFNPSFTYTVPQEVSDIVGGGPNGGATVTAPKNGWNGTNLGAIFAQSVPRDNYTSPDASSANGTANVTPTHVSAAPSNNAGVIAGSIVGALAAVALVGAAVWLFLRRRRRQRRLPPGDHFVPGMSEKAELANERSWRRTWDNKPGELNGKSLRRELNGTSTVAEMEEQRPLAEAASVTPPVELDSHDHGGEGVENPWARPGAGPGGGFGIHG